MSNSDAAPRDDAKVRRSWWPGWIWSVPIAVVIVLAWLGIRALRTAGQDITITFTDVHGLDNKAAISYRGLHVGQVTKLALADDGHHVDVSATIDQSAAQLVRSGTRFWLHNAKPSLSDLSSLGAVLSGPSIELDPGPGGKATRFVGVDRQPIAPAKDSPSQPYTLSFDGAVGNLEPGEAVKLRGFTVGEVKAVGFAFDAKSDALSTPVTIDLYPSLFPVSGGPSPDTPAALRRLVASLVDRGLRAKLDRQPPLIGAYRVVLDIEPGASPPAKAAGPGPQIPTVSGGGIGSIVDKLKDVPVGEIAQHILDVARHADALVSSPDLKDAIVQLDDALKQAKDAAGQVNQTVSSIRPKIDALIGTLDRTARQLDRTAESASRAAASANQVIGGTTSQYGLESTAREVTQAARAVRALADFLSRHPEALIRGRPGGE